MNLASVITGGPISEIDISVIFSIINNLVRVLCLP